MQKVRVLIVEDEWIISEEIKEILQKKGYEVVGQAEDAKSALEILQDAVADVVLTDIQIKGKMDGIDLAHEITSKYLCAIIFLTAFDDEHFLNRAKKVKPATYIVKPFEERNLKAAIEIAYDKISTEKDEVERQLSSKPWLESKALLVDQLTDWEKEILLLVADGLSANEIGNQLFISLHTVKTHRKNLWNKLEVKNLAELIRISDYYLS